MGAFKTDGCHFNGRFVDLSISIFWDMGFPKLRGAFLGIPVERIKIFGLLNCEITICLLGLNFRQVPHIVRVVLLQVLGLPSLGSRVLGV